MVVPRGDFTERFYCMNTYVIRHVSCVKCVEGDERAYYLKTQAERKQRFMKVNKKGLKQRGQDKVYTIYIVSIVIKLCIPVVK